MPKFVPRQRKHKTRAREQQQRNGAGGDDSNVAEVFPADKAEREERKRRLKEEMSTGMSGMSTKKKKRLDKYIETKLKKEENLDLLKKLAESKIDTSLFQSSKNLGRVHNTKREIMSRAMREKRAGIDVDRNEGLLRERQRENESSDKEECSGESENEVPKEQVEEASTQPQAANGAAAGFGSGLKRPLELDEQGKPIITKRRRGEKEKPTIIIQLPAQGEDSEDDEESEWGGFNSEGGSESQLDGEEEPESVRSVKKTEESDLDEDKSDATSEDDSVDENNKESRKERSSAFKAWAIQQRNNAIGFTPSEAPTEAFSKLNIPKPVSFAPRALESDPLPPELDTKTTTDETRKAFAVEVNRPPTIQETRLALPVVAEEQKVMEAIYNNPAVIVCGATGSGKTTQVPQFLFEAGYGSPNGPTPGMIGVTQPRRVAAVSMAARVGEELGSVTNRVAHQIRFDSNVSDNTAIKFMTDGILLREVNEDFFLRKYSAIVIDEAHERSVNTDILVGMISRIVQAREKIARGDPAFTEIAKKFPNTKPLKLVIMSATLRVSDFADNKRLFPSGPPPVLNVEGKQHKVTDHFARRTERDYLNEMYKKVQRGHKKLPKGGMLVFLTGQNEIMALSRRLKDAFPSTDGNLNKGPKVRVSATEAPVEDEDIDLGCGSNPALEDFSDDEDADAQGTNDEKDEFVISDEDEPPEDIPKVHVLPLYSNLPTNQQLRVFEPPPEGSRLIVVATNVAETSLTIPGIRYVFDCGRAKERKYDAVTRVQSFEVSWISKASASQRAGRAGRTGPGHCYKLYSSAVYERDFESFTVPEILRAPLEGVVLQLKQLGKQAVSIFPFPSPPDKHDLARAEKLLGYLGALSPLDGSITPLGQKIGTYPLSPRFARMICQSQTPNGAAVAIALVAALSVPEFFIPQNLVDVHASNGNPEGTPSDKSEDSEPEDPTITAQSTYNIAHRDLSSWNRTSDAVKLLKALHDYSRARDSLRFCAEHFLRPKALREANQLRLQIETIAYSESATFIPSNQTQLSTPTKQQLRLVPELVTSGFIDQVAIRADLSLEPPELAKRPRRAVDVPYITLFPSHELFGRVTAETDRFVYVHPSSVLARVEPKHLPKYIVYSRLQRGTERTVGDGINKRNVRSPKVRMHALTPATDALLLKLAKDSPLLEWGKPIGRIGILPTEGGRERRECDVVPSLVGQKGKIGWPLGSVRVVQRRDVRRGWVVERFVEA
ncbi:P-loop containing nucleoside triphosphate hydrolase protein [Lineolata rhizophorae]|uniref:RNA helicase n=1 Tax=Lineolata rhizophorae TaxID=578093 RepID=A0A6A6PEY9_9PEZI|nr:P-loop containing nucleoside triphosphate hydrolase protein [Lineolata rhizophorae]